MDKSEPVIKRMKWKAFLYINPSGENMQQTSDNVAMSPEN